MYRASHIVMLKKQQGFTMLEVLLTLFILTIGVLGVAGLQMRAMSSGGLAMQRNIVTLKTEEMFERMRANRANLASYVNAGDAVGTNRNCDNAVVCNGAQMAEHDMFLWRQSLSANLPNIGGITTPITVVAGAGANSPSTVTVTVNWTVKTNEAAVATEAQSFGITTQI